jgi:hypothetical protein
MAALVSAACFRFALRDTGFVGITLLAVFCENGTALSTFPFTLTPSCTLKERGRAV